MKKEDFEVERLVNYGAMDRLRQENQKREVIIGELFGASLNSPLIWSHITAWEAGGYLTFEQMLVKLALSLNDENERLKSMVINDLKAKP